MVDTAPQYHLLAFSGRLMKGMFVIVKMVCREKVSAGRCLSELDSRDYHTPALLALGFFPSLTIGTCN